MSQVVINYSSLEVISNNAMSASNRMLEYVDALSKRVNDRLNGVEEGASSNTNNCQYFVNAKIQSLNNKANEYNTFSLAVKNFYNEAREIDLDVARKIRVSKDDFIGSHDYVKEDILTEALIWAKGQIPALEFICDAIGYVFNTPGNIFYDIKEWYLHGGGKEFLGAFVEFAFDLAFIVIACASQQYWMVLLLLPGLINSKTKFDSTKKVMFYKAIGNSREARRFSKINDFGDALEALTGQKWLNTGWDGLSFLTDTASAIYNPKNAVKSLKRAKDGLEWAKYSWDTASSIYAYSENSTNTNLFKMISSSIGVPALPDKFKKYEDNFKDFIATKDMVVNESEYLDDSFYGGKIKNLINTGSINGK